jgi:hypothetical protein
MRSTRIGAAIALTVGALVLSAAAAIGSPAGDTNIHIEPGSASPGSTVTISTEACGAAVTYGKGSSEAGGDFHLFEGRRGELVGEFEIPEGTAPGSDTVTVKCPPRIKITDTYRIADRAPSGAVAAGFGAPTDKDTQIAVGGVLIAGAIAGSVIRVRRRLSALRS